MTAPIFKVVGAICLLVIGGLLMSTQAWGSTEESYVLHNGLKVILAEQPGSPVVSMRVMIKTGSSDEAVRSEYGLAHLMEHMAFKGTSRRPDPGVISSLVERNGGDMNAYTSTDVTVYYLNLPADQAALGLDILEDMIFSPTYDPKEYELEKEVVIEEIKRGQDNPGRILMENFFALAYQDHPYGRPVIGYEETVRNATVKEAKAFHDKHYRPDNAVLVVTGGFKKEELKPVIDKFYGAAKKPATPLNAPPTPALVPPSGPAVKVIESEKVALAKVVIGFRGPTGSAPESYLMDFLSSILSSGNSSRLIEIIKDEKQLVTDISAYSYTPRYQGNFIISFEAYPEKVLPATEAVLDELSRLISQPPADEELGRSKALAEKGFLSSQESALGLASQLSEFENIYGDWRLRDAYLPLWRRISPNDLAVQAIDHFKPKNMSIVVMLPKTDEKDKATSKENLPTEASLKNLAQKLSMPALSQKLSPAAAFHEFKLNSGPTLLVMRDPSLPLVNVKAGTLGGLIAETEAESGLTNFMASVWAKSTEKHKSVDLARAVEDLGAGISGFSGRNSAGLSGSFLASNWDQGLPLFIEVLTAPAFANDDIEQLRVEILAQIKAQDEQLASRVFRLLAQNLYPSGHPYSLNPLGNEKSISSFSAKDLKAFYHRLIRPENLYIVIAGDVEPGLTKIKVEQALANWKPGTVGKAPELPVKPQPIEKFTQVSEKLTRAQTHIAFGFQAPGMGAQEVPALEVLNAYLSGMSGPLFRELRDQQSLAYTVQCTYTPGLNTGSFKFYIATAPDKVEAALKGFDEIIKRVCEKNITPEELVGAKRYIIGTSKISRQTVSSRAGEALFNSLYKLGLDYPEKFEAQVEAVTADEVKAVAAKYLARERGVLAILGGEEAPKNDKPGANNAAK